MTHCTTGQSSLRILIAQIFAITARTTLKQKSEIATLNFTTTTTKASKAAFRPSEQWKLTQW
jgi:hypothetical protein